MDERTLTGLDAVAAVTTLLQRIRSRHDTAGLYEAADLQWWWRTPRRTDDHPQLLWFDAGGHPVAAAIATAWGEAVTLDPIVLPDARRDVVAHVVRRGLDHARAAGLADVEVVIDAADGAMRRLLAGHGLGAERPSVVESWMAAADRPPVGALPPGHRLLDRRERSAPHHLAARNGPDVETRLRQTSLYRPDLDLVVVDEHDAVAAYGLFWNDAVTGVGLVEPMRTETGHQRRGLARHLLAAGIERLAASGARRVKVCFDPDNAPARALYLGAGFEAARATVVLTRANQAGAAAC